MTFNELQEEANRQGFQLLKWIPVSVRLPDETDDYFVTMRIHNYKGDVEYILQSVRFVKSTNRWRTSHGKVVAWQKEPDLFKE